MSKIENKSKRKKRQRFLVDDVTNQHSMQSFATDKYFDDSVRNEKGGGMQEIDRKLVWNASRYGWEVKAAIQETFIAKRSSDFTELKDHEKGLKHKILWRPDPRLALVNGVKESNVDLMIAKGEAIVYSDMFASGHDLIVMHANAGLLKVVRVAEANKVEGELRFRFELSLTDRKSKDLALYRYDPSDRSYYEFDPERGSKLFDNTNRLTCYGRRLKKNETFDLSKFTIIERLKVWDSEMNSQQIEAEYILDDSNPKDLKFYIEKIIPAEFVAKAVGDIFTDTTTNYDYSTGTGYVSNYWDSWATGVGDVLGAVASDAAVALTMLHRLSQGAVPWQVNRGFLGFDTNVGGAVVNGATLHYESNFKRSEMTGITHDIVVVSSTHDPESAIVIADFSKLGDVALATADYSSYPSVPGVRTLVFTDYSALNMSGFTALGVRNSADIDGVEPSVSGAETKEGLTIDVDSNLFIEIDYTLTVASGDMSEILDMAMAEFSEFLTDEPIANLNEALEMGL